MELASIFRKYQYWARVGVWPSKLDFGERLRGMARARKQNTPLGETKFPEWFTDDMKIVASCFSQPDFEAALQSQMIAVVYDNPSVTELDVTSLVAAHLHRAGLRSNSEAEKEAVLGGFVSLAHRMGLTGRCEGGHYMLSWEL